MKKIPFILLLLAVFSVALAGCVAKEDISPEGKTSYVIDVKLEDESLTCSQTVTVNNTFKDGLDSLVFMLYPAAYAEGAKYSAYSEKPKKYGGINLLAVKGCEEYSLSEDGASVVVTTAAFDRGESRDIVFDYTVDLPEARLRLGVCDGYYNLSNFYPQLACFDGENFRCDRFSGVGDPVLSAVADFTVNFDIPDDLVAACPAETGDVSVADGRKRFTVKGQNMRDFAVVLNENFNLRTESYNGITVKYYSVGDDLEAEHAALAVNALKIFSENFGAYPYKNFTVAVTPFAADGMEFSGLVFIAKDASDFDDAIIHETAHQWWYNSVGSDNVNSAFLDEGLTTFVTAYYYLLDGDEAAYTQKMSDIEGAYVRYEKLQKMRKSSFLAMDQPIYAYTDYQYLMLVYYKAGLMFKSLYDTAGRAKFNKSLKLYYENNLFGFADTAALIAAFDKGMGCDSSGLINGWLSETVTVFAVV